MKQKAFLALVLVCMLGLLGCDRLRAHVAASNGYAAYQGGRFEEAVEAYEKSLAALPADTSIQRNLAFSHLGAARESASEVKAQPHFNKAVDTLLLLADGDPNNKEIVGILFDAAVDANRINELVHFFKKQTIMKPQDIESIRMLGLAELRRGNYAAAVQAFDKRLLLEPENANTHASKATLCWEWLRMDSPKEKAIAISVAEQGLAAAIIADKLDPQHPSALVYAGLLLRERASRQQDDKLAQADIAEAEKFLERMRRRQATDSQTS